MVLHKRQAMPYLIYRAISPGAEDEEEVKQYAGYVGKKCAERMLLYRSGSSWQEQNQKPDKLSEVLPFALFNPYFLLLNTMFKLW